MGQTLRTIAGTDGGPWVATLRNDGQPVSYPTNATFVATVSRGGEEASLFSPAVSWVDATAGTFALAVAGTQTAALDPGLYHLQVFVSSGGFVHPAFDGLLEILPTVGNVAPPMAWCSYQDMLDRSDSIRALQSRSDTSNFLNQRADATAARMRQIIVRYDPRPGYIKVRQNTANNTVGMDVASPTAVAPSKAALTTALQAGGLILEEKVREIVARDAIALVLKRQGSGGNGQVYRQEAADHRAMADDLFRCYQAEVDLDGDGTPDALFARDVILLPPGTAP